MKVKNKSKKSSNSNELENENEMEIRGIGNRFYIHRFNIGHIKSKADDYPIVKERIKKTFGEEFPSSLLPTSDMFSFKQRSGEERNKEMGTECLYEEYLKDWCYSNFGIKQEFYPVGREAKFALGGFTRVYILFHGIGNEYDDGYGVCGVFLSLPDLLITLHEIESLYGDPDKPLELKSQEHSKIVYYSPHRGENWMIKSITAHQIPGY